MADRVDTTQWLAARHALLEAEKAFQQAREEYAQERRLWTGRLYVPEYRDV